MQNQNVATSDKTGDQQLNQNEFKDTARVKDGSELPSPEAPKSPRKRTKGFRMIFRWCSNRRTFRNTRRCNMRSKTR